MKDQKYKPVVFGENAYSYYRNNITQQNLLLKAMTITHDPEELRRMIGVRAVADVYRTLDKMSIRKEYHKALADQDFGVDFIVKELKNIALTAKDATRLKALQAVLRSVGLERYENAEDEGKNWEEILLKAQERERGGERLELESHEYEVLIPEIPESARKVRENEDAIGKELYG